jgi:hypothetical protein
VGRSVYYSQRLFSFNMNIFCQSPLETSSAICKVLSCSLYTCTVQWALKLWSARHPFADFKNYITDDTDEISYRRFHERIPHTQHSMLYDPSLYICIICMYYRYVIYMYWHSVFSPHHVTPQLGEKRTFHLNK